MRIISGIVVVAFGLGLVGLAAAIGFTTARAERFLRMFASSARAHYIEQCGRLLVGTALVIFSPSMWHSLLFEIFGWIIVVTAVALLLVPWQWHHRFGEWAIPLAIRRMTLFAVGAFALGTLVLYSVSRAVLAQ